MLKLIARYLILLVFALNNKVAAQCPSTSNFLNNITTIQANANLSNAEKISKLKQLQQSYIKCYKSKDSVYARIVHRLGDIYNKSNNVEKAIEYTKDAVAANSSPNNKIEKAFLQTEEELNSTVRGEGGFGHTGHI